MRINTPPGFSSPYGELVVYPSADGTLFVGMIGDGPRDDDFRFHLWRQFPDGHCEWIDLGQPLWHGHLMLTPDGLYACGFYDVNGRNRTLHFLKVPGYVPMGGQVPSQPVFIPQPQPATDGTARAEAASARALAQTAKDRVDALTKQVQHHLENHPSAAPAVDWDRVRAIAAEEGWSKAGDRIWAEAQAAMKDPTHHLRALVLMVVMAELSKLPAQVDLDTLVEKVVAELQKRLED